MKQKTTTQDEAVGETPPPKTTTTHGSFRRPSEVLEDFKTIKPSDPKWAETLFVLGVSLAIHGQPEEMRRELEEAEVNLARLSRKGGSYGRI